MLDLTATCWNEPKFTIKRRDEVSRAATGETYYKSVGPALWHADLRTFSMPLPEADAMYARLMAATDVRLRVGLAGPRIEAPVTGVSASEVSFFAPIAAGAIFSVGREVFSMVSASGEVVPAPRNVAVGDTAVFPGEGVFRVERDSVDWTYFGARRKVVSFRALQVI